MKFVRTAKLGEVSWTFLHHNHVYRGRHQAAATPLGLGASEFPATSTVWSSSPGQLKAEIERLIVDDPRDLGVACDRAFAVGFLAGEPWSLATAFASEVLRRCRVSWPGNNGERCVLDDETLEKSLRQMSPGDAEGHAAIKRDLDAGNTLAPFVVAADTVDEVVVAYVLDGAHRMTALFDWIRSPRRDLDVSLYYPKAHAAVLGFPTG